MGKKKKQRRIPVKTGRVVHHFWLNIWNEPEGKLDNEMRELKKQRKFAETVRDGLRLILDLRAGSLVVLFELFPHLQERLAGQIVVSSSEPTPSADIRSLQSQVEQLTQLILQQRIGDGLQSAKMQSSLSSDAPTQPMKPITNRQIEMPNFDDDDLPTLVSTKSASVDASANLVRSMLALR